MRTLPLFLLAACASAQTVPFTLDQVMGFSFPEEMSASPAGGKLAWVANMKGVRNIKVAEQPAYAARAITAYSADDGQEVQQLRWTPDGKAIVYARGGTANPDLNPKGVAEEIWIAGLDKSAPRKLADGSDPAVSPRGDRLAYLHGGHLFVGQVTELPANALEIKARGSSSRPTWSPDGGRIAFVSTRGDHALIGLYDVNASTLRYLDPSTDFDGQPAWSPDGHSLAFLRIPATGLRAVRQAERAAMPWSIRIAAVDTGIGREVWRAKEGPGSVFRAVSAANQIQWTEGGRLVFPWEGDGWTHLYMISAAGGEATLLTPGNFEVEDVALRAGGRDVVFSSNQGDIDRRHLWRVPVVGAPTAPVALTSGTGIECKPAPLDDRAIAFLQSDAQHPVHPVIKTGNDVRDPDPGGIPKDFPASHLVKPEQVVFPSSDGLQIHGSCSCPRAVRRHRRARKRWCSSMAVRAGRCCSAGTPCTTTRTRTR